MSAGWTVRVILALALLGLGASPDDEERAAKKKALREQAERQVEEEDWKGAADTLKKLKRLCTAKERKEVGARIDQVAAEVEWKKILDARQAGETTGKVIYRVDRFLKKHAKTDDLKERARTLREELLKDAKLLLDGLEIDGARAYKGIEKIVDDPVKEGDHAMQWISKSRESDYVRFHVPETDWSCFDYLCLWIYAETPQGPLTIEAISKYHAKYPKSFEAPINVYWKGWHRVRLPLRGKGCTFGSERQPTWTHIERLWLCKDKGRILDIVIDEVCLEKALK